MDMTPREYQQYVQRKMKKSPLGKDVCLAFLVGGGVVHFKSSRKFPKNLLN